MTIIVTGGAGFIGSNFIFHMLAKYPDYRIICLDKLTYAGNLSTLASAMDNPNFRFVKADICDLEAVEQLFAEEHPDIVVNFAAESHVDRSIEDPGIFLQTNVMGTAVLMDACRKFGIKRYHQVSTDEVYGDLPLDRPDLLFHGVSFWFDEYGNMEMCYEVYGGTGYEVYYEGYWYPAEDDSYPESTLIFELSLVEDTSDLQIARPDIYTAMSFEYDEYSECVYMTYEDYDFLLDNEADYFYTLYNAVG